MARGVPVHREDSNLSGNDGWRMRPDRAENPVSAALGGRKPQLVGRKCGKRSVNEDGQQHEKTRGVPGTVDVPMDRVSVVRRMRALSQGGKLPGFEETADGFVALAYGWVFDYDLRYRVNEGPDGSTLTPTLELKRKMPAIVIAVLVASIWPGVWITDSMLATYFDWYPREFWKTCAWYLPMTILPMPWVWKTAMGRSRMLAEESARELAERIEAQLRS